MIGCWRYAANSKFGLPLAIVPTFIEQIGEQFGWTKGTGDWLGVRAAIARHQRIQVHQEAGTTAWQTHLPIDHPFELGCLDPCNYAATGLAQAQVWISPIQRQFAIESAMPQVQWHPRVLWVGIGYQRGTSTGLIEQALRAVLHANYLAAGAIAGLATLDRKANEAQLLEYCVDRFPCRGFSTEALSAVRVPNPSDIVALRAATPSVCEAAALLASGATTLRIPKQVFRATGQPGSVTIAIAQADREYRGG